MICYLRRIRVLPVIVSEYSQCANFASSSSDSAKNVKISYIDFLKKNYSSQLDDLNNNLEILFHERSKLSKSIESPQFIKQLIKRTLNHHKCLLVPVGSTVTQLITEKSDVDLVFFPKDAETRSQFSNDFHNNPSFKQHFMTTFSKLIQRESEHLGNPVEKVVELPRLRVPLLIIQYKSGMSIDIQFPDDTYHAIRNTNLIRCYKMCDKRFDLLLLWLRTVADKLQIRNSKYGLLSSYHLILLAVHFLQSEQSLSPWPVLPVLSKTHASLVSKDLPISKVVEMIRNKPPKIEWNSHNRMPISELIIRFVDYYSHFNPQKEVIHISKGLSLKRKQSFGDAQLQLIDPFSPVSVCRSPHAVKAFFDAISFLRMKFKRGRLLSCDPDEIEIDCQQFIRDYQFATWRTQMAEKHIL